MSDNLRASLASLPALTGAALADVLAERVRQIDVEGFTLQHDMAHHPGELAAAAVSYLTTAFDGLYGRHYPAHEAPDTWPWEQRWWKAGNPRDMIVKALALGLACLDRLDVGDAPDILLESTKP